MAKSGQNKRQAKGASGAAFGLGRRRGYVAGALALSLASGLAVLPDSGAAHAAPVGSQANAALKAAPQATSEGREIYNQVKDEFAAVTYLDVVNHINPRIRATDRFKIQTDLRKKLNRAPSTAEVEAEEKKRAGDALNLEPGFNKLKAELEKQLVELISSSPGIRADYVRTNKLHIMAGLTYLNRYYSMNFGNTTGKDLLLYDADFLPAGVTGLNRAVAIGRSGQNRSNASETRMLASLTGKFYEDVIGQGIGASKITDFITKALQKKEPGADANAWFKRETKAVVKEVPQAPSLFDKFKRNEN
ncbi:MAG: ZmpA/ZmpB/ZmpC family metallo-endopeptidase, partial [Microbacteriaceae bacterium]|nr:ZmpA/ZmpB/ZmpC family metallo-endopeptidase [Microbacteriaceae bacterium]